MRPTPISAREFKDLSPYLRGKAVYLMGARKDEPNIPNEENPYPAKTRDWLEWNRGAQEAINAVHDAEE